jgi:alpha-mannosidase
MKLGRSAIVDGVSHLDTETPQISVLAGGQVDGPSLGIPAQGGDSRFLQRFALRATSKSRPADSMRFALEDQNPLIAGEVSGGTSYPETHFSLLSVSDPDAMLWALKPSEAGGSKGIAARFWNMSPKPATFRVKFDGKISEAWNTTHLETDLNRADVRTGELQSDFAPWQMRTYRLEPSASFPVHPNVSNQ